MNMMSLIVDYIDTKRLGEPIFTSDIHEYVKKEIIDANPLVINEYINRYKKNNENFIRYKKGIYYKTKDTVFGKMTISKRDLIERFYLCDGDEVYGYETGPSFANIIGLTTQVPKDAYYVTNYYRTEKCSNCIKLIKPIISVTQENYKYLQVLDVILNKYDVNFEVRDPNKIIRSLIDEYKLDFELLLYYANFYKDKKIFQKIAQLAKYKK